MRFGKIYAIVPARGSSKGLPRKNLRTLGGKPLIAHTIRAAHECPEIGRCIVSTEDEEIGRVSSDLGASVLWRPMELARDESLTVDVILHVLKTLEQEGDLPDYFALLQPTSPLRTSRSLSQCINSFLQGSANSALSVTECEHSPYKDFRLENNQLVPLFGTEHLHAPRQLLPKSYRQNGAIYLVPTSLFLEKKTFYIPTALPYFMDSLESVDIDTIDDLEIAELLLSKRNNAALFGAGK